MSLINKVFLGLIFIYKKALSPFLGQHCRFHPSCSVYASQCFQEFSFLRALWYSCLRILRCNQFFKGGVDPIPTIINKNKLKF